MSQRAKRGIRMEILLKILVCSSKNADEQNSISFRTPIPARSCHRRRISPESALKRRKAHGEPRAYLLSEKRLNACRVTWAALQALALPWVRASALLAVPPWVLRVSEQALVLPAVLASAQLAERVSEQALVLPAVLASARPAERASARVVPQAAVRAWEQALALTPVLALVQSLVQPWALFLLRAWVLPSAQAWASLLVQPSVPPLAQTSQASGPSALHSSALLSASHSALPWVRSLSLLSALPLAQPSLRPSYPPSVRLLAHPSELLEPPSQQSSALPLALLLALLSVQPQD